MFPIHILVVKVFNTEARSTTPTVRGVGIMYGRVLYLIAGGLDSLLGGDNCLPGEQLLQDDVAAVLHRRVQVHDLEIDGSIKQENKTSLVVRR